MKKTTLLPLLIIASGCLQMESAKLVSGPALNMKMEALEVTQGCAQRALEKSRKNVDEVIRIKIKDKIVEKVLSELKSRSSVASFWSNLTPETAKELLIDLNLNIGPDPIKNIPDAHRAVAYYFNDLMKSNNKEESAQFKLSNGILYSYQVKGEAVESLVRKMRRCDEVFFDVSDVQLPVEAKEIKEITQTYKCKVKKQILDLVRMKDKSFIIVKDETIEIPTTSIKIKENNRKIVLSVDTKDVRLTLKFKKKREREFEEIDGHKTKIDLRTARTDIDGTGACEFSKN